MDIIKGLLFFIFLFACYVLIREGYTYLFTKAFNKVHPLITILLIVCIVSISGIVLAFAKAREVGFTKKFTTKKNADTNGSEN